MLSGVLLNINSWCMGRSQTMMTKAPSQHYTMVLSPPYFHQIVGMEINIYPSLALTDCFTMEELLQAQ